MFSDMDTHLSVSAAAHLTVRLGAIADNFHTVQHLTGGAQVAAVVKADAYGLGDRHIVPALLAAGAENFVVARLEEGIRLRTLAPLARIFVLDGVTAGTEAAYARYRLIPSLNSLEQIARYAAAARDAGTVYEAAVHIDTGMNRLGLSAVDVSTLSVGHKNLLAGLKIVLWMSHLACSDEADSPMNTAQLARFKAALAQLPAAPASLSASGGILLGKDYHFDLVRPGICLYGGNPIPAQNNPYKVAVRCAAPILQVRETPAGETVGYGASFRTTRASRLAIAAYGYADGLMRTVSNRGFVGIDGHKAPVVGRVSMDLVIADVTDLPVVPHCGMEAELFGDTVSLEDLATASGTISYEILTQVSPRAQRIYQEAA